ncbi:MAG: class B sortase [Acutalibacteraceae bacterium]|nr:class B sortase [Acutalibacteraceae bacterium]
MKQYNSNQMPDPRHRVQVVEDDPAPAARRRSSVWLTILIVVFAAVFLVSAGVLIWEMVINPFIADQNAEEIQEVFVEAGGVAGNPTEDGETQSEANTRRVEAVQKLQEINPDISGWLRIENTNINQPVLLPPADDPEYYLYRNYKREDTKYGSIFLDVSSPVGAENQLLHGHSMQDGRMFWSLISFGDPEVVKASPVIQYDTYKEAGDWKIVSVFKTNTLASQGEVFNYLQGDFASPEEKMQFYYEVMKRSMVDTGVDLNENDSTIMLSTCSYEYDEFRTVVVARKVREGEDASVDTSQIKASENPLFPDVWYASGSAPDYWPEKFEDALAAGMIDWYTGSLYQ